MEHTIESLSMGRGKVMIEPILPKDRTKGGVWLPPQGPRKNTSMGTILRKGEPTIHPKGYEMTTDCQVGDVVLFEAYGREELILEGRRVYVIRDVDLFAVLPDFNADTEVRTI